MKYILTLLLVTLAWGIPAPDKRDFVGSQVLTVLPKEISHLNYLNGLIKTDLYDFWKPPRGVDKPVDIMATRWMLPVLKKTLENLNIDYTVKINDLNGLILAHKAQNEAKLKIAYQEGRDMEWTAYHPYDDFNTFMDDLAASYPSIVTVTDVGTSYEGRTMKKMVVSTGGTGKPVVFVDGGIHAREWIAPATVTWMMNELVTNSAAYQSSLDAVDFVFMPSVNPDGYQYSFDSDRLWRKTRQIYDGASCVGADPNRNWDFHWGEAGTSPFVCSDIYTGPTPFSEMETQVLRDQILQYVDNGIVYLTFHSALEQFLRPYGYDVNVPAENEADHIVLCDDAITALEAVHGIKYECILSGELYAAAGASDDYSKNAGYEYTFTIELRDQGYGFVLPADQIIPSGEETFAAFQVIFEFVRDTYGLKK